MELNPDSRAISAYMVSSRSSCWASRFVICFYLNKGEVEEIYKSEVRYNSGTTVPGDRVPFVLMSASLEKGLYRLLCVLCSHRLGPKRERKKEEKIK